MLACGRSTLVTPKDRSFPEPMALRLARNSQGKMEECIADCDAAVDKGREVRR
jgi:hypothetical protein